MRLPSLTVLTLLVPLAAVAQTTGTEPVQIQLANQAERQILRDCGSQFIFSWQITPPSFPATVCDSFDVWLTDAAKCQKNPPEGTEPIFNELSSGGVFTRTTDTFMLNVNDLPAFKEAACGTTPVEVRYLVCARFTTPGVSNGSCEGADAQAFPDSTPPTIGFDSIAPAAPTLSDAVGLDESISVSVSAAEKSGKIIVTATNPKNEVFKAEAVLPSTKVTISKLQNFVEYTVTAKVFDEAGNESDPSNAVTATPILTCGIGCEISGANPEVVGCSAAGGATLGIFGLLSAAFLITRSRRTWR